MIRQFFGVLFEFFRRNEISFLFFCIFPPKRPQSFLPNNETNFKSSLVARKGLIFSKGNIGLQEKHKNKRIFTTRKKKYKQNAKKLPDRPTIIRGLKRYTGDIRPLITSLLIL